jgi:CHAD domain-containing protein
VLRHLLRLSPRGDPLCLAAASLDLPLPGAPVPREYLLLPADTLDTAARKILAHQAHKMWANTEGTVADLDPEFLHDLRVASRRARAALRLLVPLYGETGCRQLWDELAWIADVLGAVRDLDVFLARFDSQLARAQASDEALLGTLRARRGAARERLLQALATERYRELVRRLREMELPADAAPEQRAWADRLAVEVAPGLVGRGVKRVRRWRREVGNEPTEEQLHRLRLLLKRLRYVCEFFADVLGEPVARAIPPLVQLQGCLGDLQDAVVAAEALGELADGVSPSDPSARQQLLTIGSLIQVQREIAASKRNSFRRLWGKLPGRVRRLRRALRVLGADAAAQKAPARTAATGDPKPASSTAS